MTEFIGSRISLISKRDIRYVGTLHEISSENSTVALENVTSYGTEGRRPEEEIPPNLDNVYEYIVFRGSDVKDLRIEETPKEAKKPDPPQVPDDPAILGSTRKSQPPSAEPSQADTALSAQNQTHPLAQSRTPQQDQNYGPSPYPNQNQGPFNNQNSSGAPPFQGHHLGHQPFQYGMPGPGNRFGPGPGPFPHGAPGPGFPGAPFGAPPGWYPPYGLPPHMQGQFHHHHMPGGPHMPQNGPQGPIPASPQAPEVVSETKPTIAKPPSKESTPAPVPAAEAPPPPSDEKSEDATATPATSNAKPDARTEKSNRFIPAVPLSPAVKYSTVLNGHRKQVIADTSHKPGNAKSTEEANRDAAAAVAFAMAKISAADKKPAENGTINMEDVTKGMGELRTSDGRGRGRGRGYRGGHRGGRGDSRRVEVPKDDFDFESSNAKFNKQDLVKEAIANGSPVLTPTGTPDVSEALEKRGSDAGLSSSISYNKSSSFFDDISSEIKDRAESKETGQRLGGREFRNEERQKNLETFGQGSVDNYRYGRGRGRGRGGYSRGRGRGSYNQSGRDGSAPSRGNRDGTTTADT